MPTLSPEKAFGLIVSALCVAIGGCATAGPTKLQSMTVEGPVELRLRPQLGDKEITAYNSQTVTKNIKDGGLASQTTEVVDFKVRTEVIAVDAEKQTLTYDIKTTDKRGQFDLNDYAMPEPDEKLQLTLKSNGEVVEAKDFPRGTIFYVPPISLPKTPVKPGDSWPMEADWISVKTGIPLRMSLVTVFKGLVTCGTSVSCAHLEISGDVSILGMKSNPLATRADKENLKMRFESRVQGFLLYNLEQSTILYSHVRSDEKLQGAGETVEIASCTVSHVTSPKQRSLKSVLPVRCEAEDPPPSVL